MLSIHPYCVSICTQDLSCEKEDWKKDQSYIRVAVELNDKKIKNISNDTINYLLLQAQSIEIRLQMELIRREETGV